MRRLLRCLALVLLMLLAVDSLALAEFAARVSVDLMQVYSDRTLSTPDSTLSRNTVVLVDAYSNGVAKITYRNKSGYASVADMKALGSSARQAVVNTTTRVYQSATRRSRSAVLKRGTKVKLLATSGGYAMIEKGGYIGYARRQYITVGSDAVSQADLAKLSAAKQNVSEVVYITFQAVVSGDRLPVYASAAATAKKLGTLEPGTQVTVCAYNDTWACLQNEQGYGFCLRSGLTRAVEPTPTPAPEATLAPDATPSTQQAGDIPIRAGSFEDAVRSGRYSNEDLIFIFLTQEMQLNTAAACGVLSNIYSECSFDHQLYDGGSYGICQWLGVRLRRLQNFCAENGYDYTTLEGQLYFLEYEVEYYYADTISYLRRVENSSSGAYDAAYYWCYYYEIPANRAGQAIKRATAARDTFWGRHQ